MNTMTAEQIMTALKRRPEVEPIPDEDEPDFTYAEPEPKIEPATMPGGQS